MNKNDRLVDSVETEYEWNKGPRPSGYAKIKLKLCPASTFAEGPGEVTIHADVEKIGKIREDSYHKQPRENELRENLPKYTQMAMSGIQAGCLDALKQSLERPVTNVDIFVEELVFDLVYSTEAAFYFACKFAMSQLLQKAKSEGLLR
jgi:hypothetical protein